MKRNVFFKVLSLALLCASLLTHTSPYEELFPKSLPDFISHENLIKFIDLIGRRLVGWNSLQNGNNPRVWPCIGETVAGYASVPASLNPRHSHKSFDQVERTWCICDYVMTLNPSKLRPGLKEWRNNRGSSLAVETAQRGGRRPWDRVLYINSMPALWPASLLGEVNVYGHLAGPTVTVGVTDQSVPAE